MFYNIGITQGLQPNAYLQTLNIALPAECLINSDHAAPWALAKLAMPAIRVKPALRKKRQRKCLALIYAVLSPASNGDRGGSTNIKNNRNIIQALDEGCTVDIFVLCSQGTQQHGEFTINLSAGLEDSLINALSPPWNGRMQNNTNSAISISNKNSHAADYACLSAIPKKNQQVVSDTIIALSSSIQVQNNSEVFTNTVTETAAKNITSTSRQNLHQNANSITSTTLKKTMNLTSANLFAFARNLQGTEILTMARKTPFRIEVVGNYLEITPGSSKAARKESRESINAVLARLDKINSYQMSDYRDITFNASYILALVKHMEKSQIAIAK